MEPPVSVPSVAAARRAATAAAAPPDDPPGTRSRSQGLRVGKKDECSVDEPMANSSMFSLPRRTAPASRSRVTAVASYGGTKCSRIFDPQVVRTPRVHSTSLSAIGTPSSGPRGWPARNRASASAARASACSRVIVRNARSSPSSASIRPRYARVASVGVASPRRNRSPSSVTVRSESIALLLDDLGHPEEVAAGLRRVGEHLLARKRWPRHIVPHHIGHRHGVGGRLDAGRIQRLELVDVREDAVQLAPHALLLLGPKLEPREPRHVLDLGKRDLRLGRHLDLLEVRVLE